MGLEDKMEIFGTEWEIKFVTRKFLEKRGDSETDGLCDYDNQTIYVNKDLHPHRKRLVATHELLHVLFDHVGINYSESREEQLVLQLEHGVYELIKKFENIDFGDDYNV